MLTVTSNVALWHASWLAPVSTIVIVGSCAAVGLNAAPSATVPTALAARVGDRLAIATVQPAGAMPLTTADALPKFWFPLPAVFVKVYATDLVRPGFRPVTEMPVTLTAVLVPIVPAPVPLPVPFDVKYAYAPPAAPRTIAPVATTATNFLLLKSFIP